MALRLRVVSIHAQLLGEDGSKVFGVHGGSIGRAGDNDWVLPDPDRYVSGHHARVEHRDGRYWLTDTSSNGTYLNDSTVPLAEGGPHPLKDGDRLRLGDYEIAVDVEMARAAPAPKNVPVENDLGESLDVGSLLGNDDSGSQPLAPVNAYGQAIDLPRISATRTPLEPRSRAPVREKSPPAPEPESVPWNLATRRRIEPYRNPAQSASAETPAPEPASDAKAAAEPLSGLQALCRGAGIDPASIPAAIQPQAVQIAGQILRELCMGLMEVIQERTELRNRFRISQDTIQPQENNPLKFSAGVEEALRKLFGQPGSRYVGPVDAVRESFRDIRLHHQAVTAAMHAAFAGFINRLDPSDLQERFDRGLKRGGLLGAANKTKYWDLYAELYQNLARTPSDELPHVFVEEFARAYETSLKELAARRPRGAEKRADRTRTPAARRS